MQTENEKSSLLRMCKVKMEQSITSAVSSPSTPAELVSFVCALCHTVTLFFSSGIVYCECHTLLSLITATNYLGGENANNNPAIANAQSGQVSILGLENFGCTFSAIFA